METSHFYSIWKTSRPLNTNISFLHKTFQKTLKNTRIRIIYPKNTTSIPITLPWKYNPPGGNINYSIHMQKLCFLYEEKAVPASRSKVKEDTRKWNLPHSGKQLSFIIRRKSLTLKLIFTHVQSISEKLLKNRKHKSPPRQTFMWRLAKFELEINSVVFPNF